MAAASIVASPLCSAARADYMVHVSDGRRRVKNMPAGDEKNHYLFLHAATANCVDCVQHWIERGVDLTRGSRSNPFTAMDWAKDANATDVVALLEAALPRKRGAEATEVGLPQKVSKTETLTESSEEAGVWSSRSGRGTDVLTQHLLQVGGGDIWKAAMEGDLPTFAGYVHLNSCEMPCLACRASVPDRCFYWGLQQFLEMAQLILRGREALTSIKALESVRKEDRVETLSDEMRETAEARREWWTSGLQSVIAGDTVHTNTFIGYLNLQLPEWWTYDPFVTAEDVCLAVPAPCATWRLQQFMLAVGKWRTSQSAIDAALVALQDYEHEAIPLAYSGRHCWWDSEVEVLQDLLCMTLNA
eukprot:s4464_g5.t1